MIEIKDKSNCTGCHACMCICPRKCIEMREDPQGFRYPYVDKVKCIECGLCESVCHMKKDVHTIDGSSAFAAINKDESERMRSSSGGIFIETAKWVISRGGSVYGAALNTDNEVTHIRVTDSEHLSRLQTSKYVQSIIGNAYFDAKRDLEDGMDVLFTGTPCQIGGLKSFLKKDYENLFCQDIMCHGVPSPKLWRKYLEELNIGRIKEIRFRDKSEGWSHYHVTIEGEKAIMFDEFNKNEFMRAFIADASLRPSCYNCHYKNMHYEGDYLLADFWGISEVCPEMDDDKGVSLIIINNPKGERLINEIKAKLDIKKVDIDKALSNNDAAINGAAMNEKNIALFDNIDKMTVHQIVEKYIRGSVFRRIINKLKR